jgi:hypothetical protein
MRRFHFLGLAFATLILTAGPDAVAQPLGANPSAAPSDIRNPSCDQSRCRRFRHSQPERDQPVRRASQIPTCRKISPLRSQLPEITQEGGAKLSELGRGESRHRFGVSDNLSRVSDFP